MVQFAELRRIEHRQADGKGIGRVERLFVGPDAEIVLMNTVNAYIARDPAGVCRVFVKRAKYKHWFELGKHAPTDAAFERSLSANLIRWRTEIEDRTKLF